MSDIPVVTAKECQDICWSKYRKLFDYFSKEIAKALPK